VYRALLPVYRALLCVPVDGNGDYAKRALKRCVHTHFVFEYRIATVCVRVCVYVCVRVRRGGNSVLKQSVHPKFVFKCRIATV